MKSLFRPVIAVVAVASVLAGCGASAPPVRELADEIIDTMDVSEEVKACMREEVAGFQLTQQELQGFDSFDKVAVAASNSSNSNYDEARAIMTRFQEALASCNAPG